MTAAELIAELQKHPPQMRVLVDEHYGEFNSISCVDQVRAREFIGSRGPGNYTGKFHFNRDGEESLVLR